MDRGTRIALAGLAALAVAMGIGRFAFTPILPMMLEDGALDVAQGAGLASANYLGYLAGAVWLSTPAAARRLPGASASIRGGLGLIAAVTAAMALDAGVAVWSELRFAAGVASAVVLVQTSSWCLERLAPLVAGARGTPPRPLLPGVLFAGVGAGLVAAGVACVLLMGARAHASSAWAALGALAFVVTALVWPVFAGDAAAAAAPRPRGRWRWRELRLVLAYGAYGFGYIVPATFLPVMARDIIPDPAVFGWAWPAFGAAAVASTLGVSKLAARYGHRRAWIGSHFVMAAGVAAPVAWPGLGGIALAALCVGGTFVVITMLGLQVARAAAAQDASVDAARLMAAMTAAFAAGQIAGPLSVRALVAAGGGFSGALLAAAAVLVAGAVLLVRAER